MTGASSACDGTGWRSSDAPMLEFGAKMLYMLDQRRDTRCISGKTQLWNWRVRWCTELLVGWESLSASRLWQRTRRDRILVNGGVHSRGIAPHINAFGIQGRNGETPLEISAPILTQSPSSMFGQVYLRLTVHLDYIV